MQDATVDGEEPILNGAGREEVRRGRVSIQLGRRRCKYCPTSLAYVAYSAIPSVIYLSRHDVSYFNMISVE